MIKSVDLCFYDENDDCITMPLTAMQVKTILQILMIENNGSNIIAASDETLAKFWNMKGNPLNCKVIK